MVLQARAATQHRTKVKILNGPTMHCDADNCQRRAAYLFRTGDGPIQALCEVHASESAVRMGVRLPQSTVSVLRTGGFAD